MTVNLLDLLLLIPLLFFGWTGYRKGFIIEISTLAALILGLYFAFYFSDLTANFLISYIHIDQKYLAVVSFVVTFIAVVIVVLAIGKVVEKFINILMLGFINKLGGALFGILKGALYLSILIFIINYFDSGRNIIKREAVAKSVLYAPIASLAPMLYSHLDLKKLKFELPDKEEILKKVY